MYTANNFNLLEDFIIKNNKDNDHYFSYLVRDLLRINLDYFSPSLDNKKLNLMDFVELAKIKIKTLEDANKTINKILSMKKNINYDYYFNSCLAILDYAEIKRAYKKLNLVSHKKQNLNYFNETIKSQVYYAKQDIKSILNTSINNADSEQQRQDKQQRLNINNKSISKLKEFILLAA